MLTDAQMLAVATEVARLFELAGIAIIIAGTGFALIRCGIAAVGIVGLPGSPGEGDLVTTFRRMLGRSILTGLELLVAADIIRTVAVEPTLQSVIVLGGIVLIRTFLSFSLEVEIDGRWPWRRAGKPDAR